MYIKELIEMKKFLFLVFILLLIGGGYIYSLNSYSDKPSERELNKIEEKVRNYLIEEKKYKPSDIYSLKPQFNPNFAGSRAAYSVVVIFSDEKDVTYRYGEDENGNIIQIGIGGSKDNPKHAE
jgi:hypothetical protein